MLINLRNITKKYKDRTLFENFDYSFEHGCLYVIKGNSGSGKTSFLNILSLVSKPDNGEIYYDNRPVNDKNINLYRKKNGIILQNSYLINELTLRENLNFFSNYNKTFDEIIDDLGLKEVMNIKARYLSVGERQRANLLRVLLKDPDIIFADEPFASVDKDNINIIKKYLIEYSNRPNKTVFIVTHREDIELNQKKTILIDKKIKVI